jgi:hypothetical protein
LCNTHCFSTAIVARTRLSVTLYVHWRSCYLYKDKITILNRFLKIKLKLEILRDTALGIRLIENNVTFYFSTQSTFTATNFPTLIPGLPSKYSPPKSVELQGKWEWHRRTLFRSVIRKEQTIASAGTLHRIDWQTITEASKKCSGFGTHTAYKTQDLNRRQNCCERFCVWSCTCTVWCMNGQVCESSWNPELLWRYIISSLNLTAGNVSCPREVGGSDGSENERHLVWFLYALLMANSRSNDNYSKKTNSAPLQNKSCKSPLKLSHPCLFSLGVNTVSINQQLTLVRHELRNVS